MILGKISGFFVRNWQFTLVLFGLLAMVGLNTFQHIPRAEDPDFQAPFAVVTAVLPGADPADMEKLVVRPIEDAVNGLDDLENIVSHAEDGVASISVEFNWSTDPDKRFDDVVREVNALRARLPAGLQVLQVDKFRPSLTNMVQVALVSETAPARELEDVAKDLRDDIDRAPGVRETKIWGLPESEVRVAVNFGRLASMKIPVTAVANAIGAESADVPGGPIHSGTRRFNIKTTGGYKSLQQIRDTVVGSYGGRIVRVSDVADVSWSQEEAGHLAWFNGKRAVFVTANQKENQNVFAVRNNIFKVLDTFEKRLPKDIVLERAFDQSVSVSERLGHLYRDFAIAVGLVIFTLLPLGPRASAVVMVSIPLSLAIGLTMLDFAGFSLNQLSIAGFVLALGLLVDDSIVVVENIERHLREGKRRLEAVIAATSQISVAVVGCTAAIFFAFLPLLFLPEGAGKFTRSLPVAVVFTIIASLFVSLTIIPFLASRLLSDRVHPQGNVFLRVIMSGIHTIYRPLLHIALRFPRTTVIGALAICFASLALIPSIGFSLFPAADSRQFLVQIETPQGTGMDETKRALNFVEGVLARHKELGWRMSNLGHANPQIYYNVRSTETRANMAEVFTELDKYDEVKTPKLMDELRAEFAQYPGAQIILRIFQNGPPIEAPVAVRIVGSDLAVLKQLGAQVARIMEATPGIRDVQNPMRLDRTDLNLGINKEKAAMLGVPSGEIDRTVRLAIVGEPVGSYREANGEQYNIVVRLPLDQHHSVGALERVYVPTVDGNSVPLGLMTAPHLESGPGRIDRYNRERLVTITAYTQSGYNTAKVTDDIFSRLSGLQLPPGYEIRKGGEAEAAQKSFAGLSTAILVAIFGILAVLILEFRSFLATLVVAGVIPLGIFGGLVALWASGYSLSFTAVIGFVALIGIEIKNSILLVDFTNQLRREGVELTEAIERAGELRFLPVLLTSATAIGGLLPLALQGSGLYSPLAWVIIGGLLSSTFLSRLVTPTMYLLLAPKNLNDDREVGDAAPVAAPAE
ncbi:MAG: efflux RND transporter permease subunit [Parvibaculum sp.]|jgi:multidrug efflux pump subunit AcrB|uniref:efflux RND transporter permease subunit n=1 Tax=Parvibaculum sp. TaxID=2024848 RepID=UPI0028448D63|nr:efflux RND transporter permease subunit [Parvibaculum sp.]MDR3500251.1 efflux RND transporter permease subunit [Parvibaculum sp.]